VAILELADSGFVIDCEYEMRLMVEGSVVDWEILGGLRLVTFSHSTNFVLLEKAHGKVRVPSSFRSFPPYE